MLWWLVCTWLASGFLIPILWLLSVVGRRVLLRWSNDVQEPRASAPPPNSKRATRNRRRIGRLLLSGLAGVGAAILLFIGSFSDPITAMGNLYSAFATPAPVLQAAVKPVDIQLPEVKPADQNGEEVATPDLPRQVDVATPQNPPARTLTAMSADAPPANPQRLRKSGWQHGRGGPANAYVIQSRRGTWLFPPNPNQ